MRLWTYRRLLVVESPTLTPFLSAGGGYTVREAESWHEAVSLAPRESPSTVVLADPFAGSADEPDPALHAFIRSAPSLPVVAAVDLARAPLAAIRTLYAWGVSELVDVGVDRAPDALPTRLRSAHARPFKRRLEAGLSRHVPALGLTLIRAAAETAVDRGHAVDMAQVFAVGEKTLAGWCLRQGLPQPRRLLGWLRVLLALTLLEEPERTWRTVATGCGYNDDSGLRRALGAMLGGVPAGEGRHAWTFPLAMEVFNGELREGRERSRS